MKKTKVNYRLFFDLCVLCQHPLDKPKTGSICQHCLDDLPWLQNHCAICALPLPDTKTAQICAHCQQQRPSFTQAKAIFHYAFPIRQIISKVKYDPNTQFISHMAELMAERFPFIEEIDCIVPIPMHKSSELKRGFNQATLLAVEISKRTGIPLEQGLLIKIKATPQQMSLSRKERLRNQKGAFSCAQTKMRNVLLIDDVMTTGATFEEASRVLQTAGVERVYAYALARTDR